MDIEKMSHEARIPESLRCDNGGRSACCRDDEDVVVDKSAERGADETIQI